MRWISDWTARHLTPYGGPLVMFLAAAVCGALLLAGEAIARPGGGQNFSGGGGGGVGGGGGDGAIIYLLAWLVIRYPHVGIPVVIVVGVGWFILNRRKGDGTTRSAVRRLEKNAPQRLANPLISAMGINQLKARDEEFDTQAFLTSVRRGAESLNTAWCDEKLGDVRRFLSDGVMNRFQVLLDLNRNLGVRNVMSAASILGVNIAHVESDDLFDTIHVRLVGEARDMDLPLDQLPQQDAHLMRQPKNRYVEYWSLIRRRGARTVPGHEALEGTCPNCGAPLEVSDSVRCEHCEVIVNSGEHGWVLAEITQESEWKQAGAAAEIPGLELLREHDQGLSRQSIEDRASYLFWKWIQALGTHDASPLAKVAAADFHASVSTQIENRARSGGRIGLSRPAVGSVDLVACKPGAAEGEPDLAFVRIRWIAAWNQGSPPTPSSEILVMARAQGAGGTVGISYAKCAECAGPLPSTDAPACEYCGTAIVLNEREWHIETIARPEAIAIPTSPQIAAQSPTDLPQWALPDLSNLQDRMALLTRMAAIMAADGVVEPRERKLLKSMSKRWQVPYEQVQPILEGRAPAPDLAPTNEREKGLFLLGLVLAALVDGRVDARERRMIHGVAVSMHLPPELADEMIDAQTAQQKSGG